MGKSREGLTASKPSSLTRSGLGLCLQWTEFDALLSDTLKARHILEAKGALLVRGLDLDVAGLRTLSSRFGPISPIDDIDHGEEVLVLPSDENREGAVRGCGRLPLHTDGILRGRQIDLILLYCPRDYEGGDCGATIVCDQRSASQTMPQVLRKELVERGLQYLAHDRAHFQSSYVEAWTPVPPFQVLRGEERLTLAMDFNVGEPAAWRVRVAGCDETTSHRIMHQLEEHLCRPDYLYCHHWRRGDLLVIDNVATLHGRSAIDPRNKRMIWRTQVVFS